MNKLKRCPFCNSYETLLCNIPTGYRQIPNVWYVECLDCGCRGSRNPDKDKAIEAWNTRAERTCKNVSTTNNFRCSECDAADLDFDKPSYCHGCGAKVVGE